MKKVIFIFLATLFISMSAFGQIVPRIAGPYDPSNDRMGLSFHNKVYYFFANDIYEASDI